MTKMMLLCFLGLAVLSLSQASALSSVEELNDDATIYNELVRKEKVVGEPVDFPLQTLHNKGIEEYLKLEDQIFLGQADEHVGFQTLRESKGDKPLRRKRMLFHFARVFSAARSIFRGFSRRGFTRSGDRLTKHYVRKGNFNSALTHFNSLRPSNVKSFNGRISGRTGTVGNHRVTVRDGSSGTSRPTLEVRSHGGTLVRKFRYEP